MNGRHFAAQLGNQDVEDNVRHTNLCVIIVYHLRAYNELT